MWKEIMPELGDGEILDAAMSKPNAEFLVCGSWFLLREGPQRKTASK